MFVERAGNSGEPLVATDGGMPSLSCPCHPATSPAVASTVATYVLLTPTTPISQATEQRVVSGLGQSWGKPQQPPRWTTDEVCRLWDGRKVSQTAGKSMVEIQMYMMCAAGGVRVRPRSDGKDGCMRTMLSVGFTFFLKRAH